MGQMSKYILIPRVRVDKDIGKDKNPSRKELSVQVVIGEMRGMLLQSDKVVGSERTRE